MKPSGVSKHEGISKLFSVLKGKSSWEAFPLLPLRELVLFPHTMLPVFITYPSGISAVDEALRRDQRLFAACIKSGHKGPSGRASRTGSGGPPLSGEALPSDGTYAEGSVVRIVQHLKLPDNSFRVVLQGEYRAKIVDTQKQDDQVLVRVEPLGAFPPADSANPELTALVRSVRKSFAQYAEFSGKIGAETLTAVERSENPERVGNLISNAVAVKTERKIELLRIPETNKRMEAILETL
jgi:ATP-dependent Lon protease